MTAILPKWTLILTEQRDIWGSHVLCSNQWKYDISVRGKTKYNSGLHFCKACSSRHRRILKLRPHFISNHICDLLSLQILTILDVTIQVIDLQILCLYGPSPCWLLQLWLVASYWEINWDLTICPYRWKTNNNIKF